MNRTEIKDLLLMISAAKPAQQLNLATAPAWHKVLADIPWADASRAVIELAEEIPFIGVNDIAKRVKHYRGERIEAGFADLTPPPGMSVSEYLEWSRSVRKRLGDGEPPESIDPVRREELPAHNIRALLGRKP